MFEDLINNWQKKLEAGVASPRSPPFSETMVS